MVSINGIQNNNYFNVDTDKGNSVKQIGSLASFKVESVPNPVSALQDSSEEMTFAFDNSKKTKLSDRKQRDKLDSMKDRILELSKIVSSVSDSKKDNLDRFFIKWSNDKTDSYNIQKDIQNLYKDVAHQYAILHSLYDTCDDLDLKNELKKALDSIYENNSSHILASLHSVDVADNYTFANPLDLVSSYVKVSHDFSEAFDIINYLKDNYGKDHIQDGIDFLFKALFNDLNSQISSQDDIVLKTLASSLTRAKEINSALSAVNSFIDRVNTIHNIDATNLNAFTLLHDSLDLSENNFISTIAIRSLYKGIKEQDIVSEVLLSQEFKTMIQDLNLNLFKNIEYRTNFIEAINKYIDTLIQKEDEYLASL